MSSNKDLENIEAGVANLLDVMDEASAGLGKNLSQVFSAVLLAMMTEFTTLQRGVEGCTEDLLSKEWANLFNSFAKFNKIGIHTEVPNGFH